MDELFAQMVGSLESDLKVMGVLLTGSRAQGNATPSAAAKLP
ncbi:hypothetical protein [Meiothermus cerbereus]